MHLALYRKYRPRTFEAVISQPHITTTLQNQIKTGQIAHAYLFTGARGTGKTSCAKILAKAVNCLSPTDGNCCLECENCKTADRSPDIHEIDAASNNSVDDIRALREEAGYLPAEMRYKVYIIDEVHMLSISAFNALLKILEEPPAHIIFILATTEIHKIPATVLSRCQRFEFNRINADESAQTLVKIAEKEGITLKRDAAVLISRLSDGGMRDALSLLDVAASENTVITQQTVRDSAGIAGKEHLFAIAGAVADKDGRAALTVTSELYAKSKDPLRLVDELLQHFRNLMLLKVMQGDNSLLTALPEEIPDYQKQAERFTVGEIVDVLDKLEDCLRLKGRKLETEICLMRLCIGVTDAPASVPSANLGGNPKPVQTAQPVRTPTPPPVQVYVPEPPQPPPPVYAPPPPEPVYAPPPPEPPFDVAPEPVTPPSMYTDSNIDWQAVFSKLTAFQSQMLEQATVGESGNIIVFSGGEMLSGFFDNPGNTSAIERAVREVTGESRKVVFDKVGTGGHSNKMKPLPSAESVIASAKEKQSKVYDFLESVKTSGVEVQYK